MRRRVFVIALLLVATAVLSPAAASPQPTPVCRFCGGQFEAAAADAGVNATVTDSEVLVAIHDDGTATWTVRLGLANGSAAFADAPRRLESAARALIEDGYGLPESAAYVEAGLEGDVVVLEYRDAEAATRRAGVLVVDYLHDGGYEPWYHVNADRFVIRGPSGSVVVNDPESGRVDDDTVTWYGEGAEQWYDGTDLEGSPYVVFGPDRSAITRLRSAAAVGLATLPIVARGLRTYLLVQTAIFTVVLGIVVAGFSRWSPRPRVDRLAGAFAVLGLAGIVIPTVANGPAWVTGPPVLALGIGGLVLAGADHERLDGPWPQAASLGALLVGTYALLLVAHSALAAEWTRPPIIAFRATALAFPLAAMVPLGGALATRPDRIRPWFGLAVLGFGLVPVSLVNVVDPPVGLAGGIYVFVLLIGAIVAPLIGSLGLALGATLADD